MPLTGACLIVWLEPAGRGTSAETLCAIASGVSAETSGHAASSAYGTSSGRDHSGWAGILEANEQAPFPPFPCDRYPAAGHPLPDLPLHRRVPARQPR